MKKTSIIKKHVLMQVSKDGKHGIYGTTTKKQKGSIVYGNCIVESQLQFTFQSIETDNDELLPQKYVFNKYDQCDTNGNITIEDESQRVWYDSLRFNMKEGIIHRALMFDDKLPFRLRSNVMDDISLTKYKYIVEPKTEITYAGNTITEGKSMYIIVIGTNELPQDMMYYYTPSEDAANLLMMELTHILNTIFGTVESFMQFCVGDTESIYKLFERTSKHHKSDMYFNIKNILDTLVLKFLSVPTRNGFVSELISFKETPEGNNELMNNRWNYNGVSDKYTKYFIKRQQYKEEILYRVGYDINKKGLNIQPFLTVYNENYTEAKEMINNLKRIVFDLSTARLTYTNAHTIISHLYYYITTRANKYGKEVVKKS